MLEGEHTFTTITVRSGAVLRVRSAREGGLGWLRLRANVITVESGGLIDATGAGPFGQSGQDGGAPPGETGGVAGPAGGGGGHVKPGDTGRDEACFPMVLAGPAFVTQSQTSTLPGAAGGGVPLVTPAPQPSSRGGSGGGVVLIQAGSLVLHGTLSARGEDGLTFGDPAQPAQSFSSGGGAGGTIRLSAGRYEGAGTLDVRGGSTSGPRPGGGGSGGRVVVDALSAVGLGYTVLVDGGVTGACPTMTDRLGEYFVNVVVDPCPDLDNDGELAASCGAVGGADCDDTDPLVRPGNVVELCDGVDNDCNGSVDDGADVSCFVGASCELGACVLPEVDAGPPGETPARPARLEYVGACSAAPGARDATTRGVAALALFGLGLGPVLFLRRSRARERARRDHERGERTRARRRG